MGAKGSTEARGESSRAPRSAVAARGASSAPGYAARTRRQELPRHRRDPHAASAAEATPAAAGKKLPSDELRRHHKK